MRGLRVWATPLVVGSFGLMAVSGVLMFFHLESGLSKDLHEWAGFVLLAGAGAHLLQNWRAFTTYLRRPAALGIMGVGLAVTAVSLLPSGTQAGNPLRPVMESVSDAKVPVLASLTGQSVAEVMADLSRAGFQGVTEASSIHSLAGEDRDAQTGAMAAVFASE